VSACQVAVPLVGECYANMECKVIDMKMATKYNIFILEVLKAWITPSKKRPLTIHHNGNGVFTVDGKVIKTVSKKK
jgi:flavin reductase (DIM6/NTAB) family NADH-FMN oxidoreductase RutF